MKIPIVKEWGSWAVFISSWLAALVAGLLTRPWEIGRDFSHETVLTILGLTFLINSKNPLASIIRAGLGPSRLVKQKKEHLLWFLFFSTAGLALLIPFLIDGLREFSLFSLLVLSYIILLARGKEHHIIAELNGFALLCLSAPVVYFVITGEMSIRLYAAVLIFFAAAVFKVRVKLKKTLAYRQIMIFYCAFAVVAYSYLNISLIILLPLAENIFSALFMREERLRTTGNTELIKGIVFVVLVGLFWK